MTPIFQILQKMFTDEEFKRVIAPFRFSSDTQQDKELKKDFEQDLIILLSEYWDQGKIIEMYERDKTELVKFIHTIIKNNIHSYTSPYYYKYGMYERNKTKLDKVLNEGERNRV